MPKNDDCKNKLWSFIGKSDGDECPCYNYCRNRIQGGWCPSDDKNRLLNLNDSAEFDIRNYDFIKPTPCDGGPIHEGIVTLVEEYIKAGGISRPPLPSRLASLIIKQNTVEVRQVPLKANHGALWRLKDTWIIHINEDDSPETQRYTLFHEIFHVLAHNNGNPVFKKRGSVGGSFNELVADKFASYILMPPEWIMEMWPKINDLERMAKIFDVSKSAMCIRLKFRGLI